MFLRLNEGEFTLVEKKSEFIARSYNIESRDEAKAIQAELKKEHLGARHVCYGYIADEKGDDFGYDDDGEPSGTAGKPIYSALVAAGAKKSMIAVVRYFGGIKLGAGGLTRAYRQTAAELIKSAGMSEAIKLDVYVASCDNETFKKVCALLRKSLCKTEQIMYNERVSFTILAPCGADIVSMLAPLGITPQNTGSRYISAEEKQ